MQNAKVRMQNAKVRRQKAECKMQNAKVRMQKAECRSKNAEVVCYFSILHSDFCIFFSLLLLRPQASLLPLFFLLLLRW
jgi:hypothetical protein